MPYKFAICFADDHRALLAYFISYNCAKSAAAPDSHRTDQCRVLGLWTGQAVSCSLLLNYFDKRVQRGRRYFTLNACFLRPGCKESANALIITTRTALNLWRRQVCCKFSHHHNAHGAASLVLFNARQPDSFQRTAVLVMVIFGTSKF